MKWGKLRKILILMIFAPQSWQHVRIWELLKSPSQFLSRLGSASPIDRAQCSSVVKQKQIFPLVNSFSSIELLALV